MKIQDKRRGVSGLLSALIVIAVTMLAISSLILLTVSQDNYTQSTLNILQNNLLREKEVLSPSYIAGVINVSNTGSVNSHITGMITYTNNMPIYTPENIYLAPGQKATITQTIKNLAGAALITAYGNSFPIFNPFTTGSVYSQIANSIGAIQVVQDSLRFYYTQSYTYGNGYPVGGYLGYATPGSTDVVFSLTMQNFDSSGRNVTINSNSMLFFTNPGQAQGSGATTQDFIVQGISSSSPYTSAVTMTPFTSVTIPYGSEVTLYFGASSAGGNSPTGTLSSGQPVEFFLLMFGKYSDNSAYAQTIPFEAAYLTGSSISSTTTSGCAGSTYTAKLKSFNIAPNAYIVNGNIPTQITSGTPTTSQVSFTIPSGTSPGYYQIFFGANGQYQAYQTFDVTC